MGIFKKINFGLRKTRNNMSGAIDNVLDSYTSIDEELFDELEEALVMGDVGVTTASEITKRLNDNVRKKGLKNPADVKNEIKDREESFEVTFEKGVLSKLNVFDAFLDAAKELFPQKKEKVHTNANQNILRKKIIKYGPIV